MGETVTATLSAVKSGKRVNGTPYQTSILAYTLDALDRFSDDDALVTLLVDLLSYGAAAQVYFDQNASHPVTEGLSPEILRRGTQGAPQWQSVADPFYEIRHNSTLDWTAANLRLESSVELQLYFSYPEDPNGILLEARDEAGELFAAFRGDAIERVGENEYRVRIDSLTATQFRAPIDLVAYGPYQGVTLSGRIALPRSERSRTDLQHAPFQHRILCRAGH